MIQTPHEFRPGRQTMQNVKPGDYVPYEDAARQRKQGQDGFSFQDKARSASVFERKQ